MTTFWQLAGFVDALNRWLADEDPPDHVRIAVAEWVLSVADDAYTGARRQTQIAANLWLRRIPGTFHDGRVVVATYWIDEQTRTLTCDIVASLSLPI